MATADPDGKFAQMLSDRLACLGIEINESMRAAGGKIEALLATLEADDPEDPTADDEPLWEGA